MKTAKFKCRHCGRLHSQRVSGQKYCGEKGCQIARKRAWSRKKYESDPDYRKNQKESTESWLATVGGAAAYYREYRRRQKRRNKGQTIAVRKVRVRQVDEQAKESLFAWDERSLKESANRDAYFLSMPIKTGIYRISPVRANRDAIMAEIRVIS